MFVTQQNSNPIISDVNYQDPNQVEILRQQLVHQYENFCYGSKRISFSSSKKQYSNYNHNKSKDNNHRQHVKSGSQDNKSNRNKTHYIQNEKLIEALNQPKDKQYQQQSDIVNKDDLYKIEIPKTSQKQRKSQNESTTIYSPKQQRNKGNINHSSIDQTNNNSFTQRCLSNQAYLSPLIQSCLEEEILTSDQQRYSSVPSKKYLEMYDYSKDKLQQIQGITGYYEVGKLNDRIESPIPQQQKQKDTINNQQNQLYNVEIQNQKDNSRRVSSQNMISSINYTSLGLMHPPQSQSSQPSPRIIINSYKNTQLSDGDHHNNNHTDQNKILLSQKNSQEEFKDVKKKIDFTESYEIGKGRGSVQLIKSSQNNNHNPSSALSSSTAAQNNIYWTTKKRNSTGLITQFSSLKKQSQQDEDNYLFTSDQRHTHQLIKNSGIYLRNKPEYLSDPRYKLIENLNKVSQTVNIRNINNNSVREGEKKKNQMSRIIPYCHNFITSFKESFYHPQTSYENKYKIYNPKQDKNYLPHQKQQQNNHQKYSLTPGELQQSNQMRNTSKEPIITPFSERNYCENDEINEIRYPNKNRLLSSQQQNQNDEDDENNEEFQYYQGSSNRYNCLYLNRNQRVRLSRNSSPNRKKKEHNNNNNNNLNHSLDSQTINHETNNNNSVRKSVQYEDPRKEYRDQQKKLEEMLVIASGNNNNKQNDNHLDYNDILNKDQQYAVNEREGVYLKKSRNYNNNNSSRDHHIRSHSITTAIPNHNNNQLTLDTFIFKKNNHLLI